MNRRIVERLFTGTIRWNVCLGLILWPLLVAAQTNHPPAPGYPANRYLLVVETSRAMQHASDGMAQTVQTLVGSTLARQARRGDTLGVWTFNEELHTGLLPLQQWSSDSAKAVADRVVGFLRAQPLEKKSRLDNVVPMLNRVVKNSPFLTVILVCQGDEEIHGTPFDQAINEFFQSWRVQQQAARIPFVVALRAQAGSFVDYSMNPAPWPVELPALPKELFVPIPTAHPPVAEVRKPATSSVPPLIISGKKHETPLSVTNAGSIAAVSPGHESTLTNPAPPPRSDSTGAPAAEPSQKPAALPLAQTGTPPQSVSIAAAPQAATTSALSKLPSEAPPTTQPASKSEVLPPIVSSAPSPPQAALTGSTDSQTVSPLSAPTRATAAPQTLLPLVTARAATLQAKVPSAQSAAPRSSDSSTTAPEVATVAPTATHFDVRILWLAGLVLLAGVLISIWLSRRRSRSAEETSLITESIDRDKR